MADFAAQCYNLGFGLSYSCISYTFYNVNKYNYYNDKKRFTTCRVYVGNK